MNLPPCTVAPSRPGRRQKPMAKRGELGDTCGGDSAYGRRPLARYLNAAGASREVVVRPGAQASVLVIDRDSETHCDELLIAHLAADEPLENAGLICRHYLDDARRGERMCRAVIAADFNVSPTAAAPVELGSETEREASVGSIDREGCRFAIESVPGARSARQLRWCREPLPGPGAQVPPGARSAVISVRDVIARFESYEPAVSITRQAIALEQQRGDSSVAILGAELTRVRDSPIVLNRALREAVVERVRFGETSMSEIAMRCGRIKRDRAGNESGETSWLARRLGLLAEGGRQQPTPWIHSNVLGLIARDGLAISPREVEL